MKIPEIIKELARELIEGYGEHFRYLGKIETGHDAYTFDFPEEQEVGFPSVYLYDGHFAFEISGFEALHIIDELRVE